MHITIPNVTTLEEARFAASQYCDSQPSEIRKGEKVYFFVWNKGFKQSQKCIAAVREEEHEGKKYFYFSVMQYAGNCKVVKQYPLI